MDRILIVYPVFSIFILTFLVMIKMRLVSVKFIKEKKISFNWFKLYKGEVPEELDQARQHYKNLFETPILFYVLVAIIYAADNVNRFDLIFAWLYVLFKYLHSYVRLTSNYVPNRARLFILSLLMILCGWINFLIR